MLAYAHVREAHQPCAAWHRRDGTLERLLVVGDALSDYDVGWVNLALDDPDAASADPVPLHKLVDLDPLVVLLAHWARCRSRTRSGPNTTSGAASI
jgi:hypothetical protein